MRRDELAIEQGKTAQPHARDKMCKRHLRGIGFAAEHRFAEKGAAQLHSIEPADQPPFEPCLDTVRVGQAMQHRNSLFDLVVDPGGRPVFRGLGAKADNLVERAIDGGFEPLRTQGLGERAGKAKILERQDTALARLDPIDLRRLAPVCHREDTRGISLQQQRGIERFGHGTILQPLSRATNPRKTLIVPGHRPET